MSTRAEKMAIRNKMLEEIFRALAILDFQVGTHFSAVTTYVIDPHNFFIMPYPCLYHLMRLNKPGLPILSEELKENSIVIFKMRNPDAHKYRNRQFNFIRGLIQHIAEDNTCEIYALDRGFIERDVSADNIFHPASPEALITPSMTRKCQLDLCVPLDGEPTFSQECIQEFKLKTIGERVDISVCNTTNGKLVVSIYNKDCGDVTMSLAMSGHADLCLLAPEGEIKDATVAITRPRVYVPDLTYHHRVLNVGEILKVRMQSGNSINAFYVIPVSSYRKYIKNRVEFTSYCSSQSHIGHKEFVSGTVVGVCDDDSDYYERAVIIETTPQNNAKVMLLDWGTVQEVSRMDIKAVKCRHYLSTAAYALFCSMVNVFEPWENGKADFLSVGRILAIKVVQVGNGFSIPHIVEPEYA